MGKANKILKQLYNETHYKRFICDLKFELFDEVDKYIKKEGISRSKFIERALRVLKP
jgi:metal-responsive CopG/Arc/MetJ family transcriptional regulator